MITLDQVLLLEQRVESAVKKIQQLESENDALRKECSKLKNAFDAQSEQLSSLQGDQNQIEDKIRKALDRLNSIENSVMDDSTKSNAPVFNSNTIKNRVSEVFVSGNTISSLSNQTQNQELNEEYDSDDSIEDSNNADFEPSEINIPINNTNQDNFSNYSSGVEENISSYEINPDLTVQDAINTQSNFNNASVTFNDMNPVETNNISANNEKIFTEISESEKELGATLNPFNFEETTQDDYNESDDQSDGLSYDIF